MTPALPQSFLDAGSRKTTIAIARFIGIVWEKGLYIVGGIAMVLTITLRL